MTCRIPGGSLTIWSRSEVARERDRYIVSSIQVLARHLNTDRSRPLILPALDLSACDYATDYETEDSDEGGEPVPVPGGSFPSPAPVPSGSSPSPAPAPGGSFPDPAPNPRSTSSSPAADPRPTQGQSNNTAT